MSQPNDPHLNENDDLSLGFPELESELAENPELLDPMDDFPDLDFSGFDSEEPVFPSSEPAVEGDFAGFGESMDQEAFAEEIPQSEDVGEADLDFSAPPEPGKKGEKAKKEKPPKVKKEKPAKVKKEKPPKKPRDPNAPGLRLEEMLALGACALIAVIFVVLSVFSLGNMKFLIGMNLTAVVMIAVPFLLFKFGRESSLTLFDVSLGMTVIALSIGVVLLLASWNRYDFTIKPSASLNESPIVSHYDA